MGTPIGTGAKGVEKNSSQENSSRTVKKVYFGVFFDGTGAGGGLSKGREPSNIELLQTYFKEDKSTCKLYLKGIGVADSTGEVVKGVAKIAGGVLLGGIIGGGIAAADSQAGGLAIGTGALGIEAKVKKAIKDIPVKIQRKELPENSDIDLYFELFGFSRGAAAARHFVSEAIKKKTDIIKSVDKKLKPINSKVKTITISYVGLFDTVSSHGLDFSDDVEELGLDAIRNAKHVFHICAADEFRKLFSLTNIKSAINAGVGEEIFIPGSHTDIGGGIDPNWKNKAAKYGGGWTDSTEKVKSGYSHIALNLMAEESNKKRTKFKNIEDHEVPSDLKKTEQTIKTKKPSLKSAEDCFNLQEFDYKNLRGNWLHFSVGSREDAPRIVEGNLERELIHG